MSFFQALLLGIVQGLTEFFPVSSSAHLRITKWFLGIHDGEHLIYFDLFCHLGTLIALLFYLRKEVLGVLKDVRKMTLYFLALVPLVPTYFLLKPLRVAASHPGYLGYALFFTSALLFMASRKKVDHSVVKSKWSSVLCIGLMQTMALIPGISRSGTTISAARFCGWEWKEAAQFSFLLAIPTILGGELLETLQLFWGKGTEIGSVSPACYWAGFGTSFAFGLIAVRFIFWVYETGKVRPFAWYCLAASLFSWAIFHG